MAMHDYSSNLNSFVWSSMHYISKFFLTVYFHLKFLCKSELRISNYIKKVEKLLELNIFPVRKTILSFTFWSTVDLPSFKKICKKAIFF